MKTTFSLLSACGLLLASTGSASADGGVRISIGGIGIRIGHPPVVHCAPPPCPPVACRPACDDSCHVVRYREQTVWETVPRTHVWYDACGRRHERTTYERVCRTILVPIDPCENPCRHHCDGRCGWGDQHRRDHRWGDGERRWGDGERQRGSDADVRRGEDRGREPAGRGAEPSARTDAGARTNGVERTDATVQRRAGANAPARDADAQAASAAKRVIRPTPEAATKAQIAARIRGKG